METSLDHIQVNVAPENLPWYRGFLAFLGWEPVFEMDNYFGMRGASGASLWFSAPANGAANDYDGAGVNHVAIAANSIADVDAAIGYLAERGISGLFETPRHREVPGPEERTYYQIMFETPDRVLFEVHYIGPK
ncbi:MAG: VOC family protein [Dehalococcoidia bacterium]|nr:VOC family protein [Dehalococcoidia bacterium]